jgi:hypothetical protein
VDFANAIQTEIYSKLTTNLALAAVVGNRIYDDVPQNSLGEYEGAFPYVSIGEDNLVQSDTDTSHGCVGSIVIHTWGRVRGRKEVKNIQGAIYDALHHQELTVSGYAFVFMYWDNAQSFVDSDGKTRHGVSTFNIMIDEAE